MNTRDNGSATPSGPQAWHAEFGLPASRALASTATGLEGLPVQEQSAGPLKGTRPSTQACLHAVVQASACLLAAPDLVSGMQAAIQALQTHTGLDRVYVFADVPGQQGVVLLTEALAPNIPSICSVIGDRMLNDAEFPTVLPPLRAGQVYQSVHPQRTGENADFNTAVATRSDLMLPVFVGGHFWGIVGFDDCHQDRAWDAAEVLALQGAAAAVSAAVQRSEAQARWQAEQERRTAESQALSHLLEGVVQASRALLDASDFEQGLQRWLAFLARAVDADAAMLGSFEAKPPAGTITGFSHYWARNGSPFTGNPVPATSDFVSWAKALQRGEWIWADRDELQDPASVAFWVESDCFTNLLMPVVCDGRTVGWLGFDWRERQVRHHAHVAALRTAADGAAAALQRQNAVQALLAERDRRIASEQARADEAERLAERTQRHSRLLAAVAESAEDLLAAANLHESMGAVLARIGTVSRAERACLARLDWTPEDSALHGWQEIAHEWARPGVTRQMDGPLRRFPMRRDDPTWQALLWQIATERRLLARIADLDEPCRSEQQSLGVVWSLCYPVLLEGQVWGLMGLDFATPIEDYDEADLAALQIVASTIADAMHRQELECRALAAERKRADESARLAGLLGHVVSSSRALIDADRQAFGPALRAWLGGFCRAVGAIRCSFYDHVLAEWVSEGMDGNVNVSFAAPLVIDPRGAELLMARLTSGRATVIHTADTAGSLHEFLAQQGSATVVAVPLVVDGKPWGTLSFDHAVRRDPQPGELAVLQTAADTLVAILKRNEALQRMLGEREARLVAEQRRSIELVRVNSALRQSLDTLAGQGGEAAFLGELLVQMQCEVGAQAAYLFRNDDADGRLRLMGRAAAGRYGEQTVSDDAEIILRAFEAGTALMEASKPDRRFLWRRVGPQLPASAGTAEAMQWHLRMGHLTSAVHALTIGERQVGLIGMVFDRAEPLTDTDRDLAHALSQPITLSLELTRLSRLAQRGSEQSAMLKERNRLAREIHDGIAQSFLAIQMQLDSLGAPNTAPAPVQRALALARQGLAEARRAVAALRPQGLHNGDLPGAIRHLLHQIERAGALSCSLVCPPAWQRLPADVEDHMFRILQEAANNAVRHARARWLKVELSQATGEATVLVADDGVGFEPAGIGGRQGFGLESMQQRAQIIGARIDWLSQPGKGTQVLLSWTSPATPAVPAPAPHRAAR
jgi:signal transduction histidine kinase/putative methionine-R-sulfoxide reductase with GAF domain